MGRSETGICNNYLEYLPPTAGHLPGMQWLWPPFLITWVPLLTLALPGDHSHTALLPVSSDLLVFQESKHWEGGWAWRGRQELECGPVPASELFV